jgi:uncharacterized protein with NRDE domain
MCTLVLLRRPEHRWPLLVAANRDEMEGRPWSPPGRHWPDRADVVAGRDDLGGGSWLGVNDYGVVAAILNRVGTLGPAPGKRSRGELVLEALDHADSAIAAQSLAELDGRAWRPFNMVVADNRDAFWLRASGGRRVEVFPIPPGLHMITALDLDDAASPRIAAYHSRFAAAVVPDPDAGTWDAWQALLADTSGHADGEEAASMCFRRPDGFGTVSSSLLAVSAPGEGDNPPRWLFAAGRPDSAPFSAVDLRG